MAELAPFAGFGPDAMGFLEGLSVDNSKIWFDANRSTYEQQVFAPLKSLVVAVGEQLQDRVGPGVQFGPKVGKSMFRINRDLRFSTDRTPYHTHLDAVFWEGSSPRRSPAFILRVAPDEVVVGAGVFGLAGERLDRWRAAVLDDNCGPELVDVINASRMALRGATLSEPTRKTVPRGLPAEHPRADLLRRDGLHLSATAPTPVSITSARFATWVADRHEKLAGLHRWLVRELGD